MITKILGRVAQVLFLIVFSWYWIPLLLWNFIPHPKRTIKMLKETWKEDSLGRPR